jgi:hypothetical protein
MLQVVDIGQYTHLLGITSYPKYLIGLLIT